MSSLRDRLVKNTRIKETRVMKESEFFNERDMTPTDIPIMNLALSGRVDGGIQSGSTVIAGPSRHFKSKYALHLASCYLKAHPEAVLLFYDSEFGSPQSYFTSEGIDLERVVHCPVKTVEELKNDVYQQLDGVTRSDRLFILIDSIGGLASKKEVDDAMEGKDTADMTRARAVKALFRIVRPHLILKNIPMVCINHTYKTMEMYSKDVMSGGTGPMYNADDVWFVGRAQEKEDKEVVGYHFTIKTEKSRLVKDQQKFPIYVDFEKGIDRWSGLVDLAVEAGIMKKRPGGSKGTIYVFGDSEFPKKEFEAKQEYLWPLYLKPDGEFATWLTAKYALPDEVIKARVEAEKNEL
jgi:hypothetical protein